MPSTDNAPPPPDEKKNEKKERQWPFEFSLSRPLQTHQGDVTKIMLNELTAKDMADVRTSPIVASYISYGTGEQAVRETKIEERFDLMLDLAARMSGIDSILLGAMPGKDFRRLATIIGEAWRQAEGE